MFDRGQRMLRGGLMVLDKPSGVPSRTFGLNLVTRFLEVQSGYELDWTNLARKKRIKVGHFGTLDPFATGVLPVAFGNATRLGNHLNLSPKVYIGRLKLGSATDTDDLTGQVIESLPVPKLPPIDELNALCASQFTGDIKQVPPKYSAIHIGGVRAYELARADAEFDMPERTVSVGSFDCRYDPEDPAVIEFKVSCGPGTYIRTLGTDLAVALGTRGHLVALRRVSTGDYSLSQSFYTTEQLMQSFRRVTASEPTHVLLDLLRDGRSMTPVLFGRKGPLAGKTVAPGKYALYSREEMPLALLDISSVGSSHGRKLYKVDYIINLFGGF